MSATRNFIAIDLGASGGRTVLARLQNDRLTLAEIHRFEHHAIHIPDSQNGLWCWDVLLIWNHLKRGISLAAAKAEKQIHGIGIASWGVDYALLDKSGRMIRPTIAYRDPRTLAAMPRVIDAIGEDALYKKTGIQTLSINTIFQLAADADDSSRPLDRAATMLMIPQLFGYWLSGEKIAEHTLASTTQIYDSQSRAWVDSIADTIGVPKSIFPQVIDAGTISGALRPALAQEFGLNPKTPLIAVGSHDTASAVVATPLVDKNAAYLSSGTWSLLGMEIDLPIRTREARLAKLTNEAGISGTTRLLKNLNGMWLVQECRRCWKDAGKEFSFEQLAAQAEAHGPTSARIDPNDPSFSEPGDMPARIADACESRGHAAPKPPGEFVQCILESLAENYAATIRDIEQVVGKKVSALHVVGGGGRNVLLNRLTADAAKIPLHVGPHEATSAGNALVQAMAIGELKNLDEVRNVVRRSFEVARIN